MTSFRQMETNRRNALRSTGPKPHNGKRQSRRNALRHGLTAETVIEGLEDTEDYRAFEAAIISDYDAETAVERELVLRLASLLWRMRRAISIETDLLTIQAEILRDRRNELAAVGDNPLPRVECGFDGSEDADAGDVRSLPRALTYCFLRLGNLDNGAFERLGRYHAALWRQTAQTLFLLQSTGAPEHCDTRRGRLTEGAEEAQCHVIALRHLSGEVDCVGRGRFFAQIDRNVLPEDKAAEADIDRSVPHIAAVTPTSLPCVRGFCRRRPLTIPWQNASSRHPKISHCSNG
jgi:hypothetical protein